MSCMLSAKGLVLATSMAISAGTVILLDLLSEKYFTANQDSPPAKQVVKSCLSSGSRKTEKGNKEKKKKRVQFADGVKDSKGDGELYRKQHRRKAEAALSWGNEYYCHGMPANQVALYSGILKNRLQRMEYSY